MGDRSVSGRVELEVSTKDTRTRHYVLVARGGRVAIEEHPEPEADARVAGSEKAWIEAFSPDGSYDLSPVTSLSVRPLWNDCSGTPRRITP